jgi:hypothetical protein
MGQRPDISRRDFLSGSFRGRDGTAEAPAWSHPLDQPDQPEWGEQGLERVLESLHDLSGIEDP